MNSHLTNGSKQGYGILHGVWSDRRFPGKIRRGEKMKKYVLALAAIVATLVFATATNAQGCNGGGQMMMGPPPSMGCNGGGAQFAGPPVQEGGCCGGGGTQMIMSAPPPSMGCNGGGAQMQMGCNGGDA